MLVAVNIDWARVPWGRLIGQENAENAPPFFSFPPAPMITLFLSLVKRRPPFKGQVRASPVAARRCKPRSLVKCPRASPNCTGQFEGIAARAL